MQKKVCVCLSGAIFFSLCPIFYIHSIHNLPTGIYSNSGFHSRLWYLTADVSNLICKPQQQPHIWFQSSPEPFYCNISGCDFMSWWCVFVLVSSPLSSCLISRLACVVVNWFTMSRAVWLRVFLTPALMPLCKEEESKKKKKNKMLSSSSGSNVYMLAANVCVVSCLSNDITIHLKVTKGLKNKTELVWILHDR